MSRWSILGLHHRKRELAAGILEGSELAGTMSEADLIELIRDGCASSRVEA